MTFPASRGPCLLCTSGHGEVELEQRLSAILGGIASTYPPLATESCSCIEEKHQGQETDRDLHFVAVVSSSDGQDSNIAIVVSTDCDEMAEL